MLVRVAAARGSTPREAGACMLVGPVRLAGTIGGGRLEWEAVGQARRILAGIADPGPLDLPLGPKLGQCCGGLVTLTFEQADAGTVRALEASERTAAHALPSVYVFGAGHVGKALATALSPLPLCTVWVDSRAEEFPDRLPPGIAKRCVPDPLAEVAAAPPGAALLVLTHCHDLDFALAGAALRRGDLSYVGLIGSATKRAKFLRGFRGAGGTAEQAGKLVCPIGGDRVRDKRPAVIAALAVAEVLTALATRQPTAEAPGRTCLACKPGERCMDAAPPQKTGFPG
ncbi:xanthine dehydrogenase accessory protein XdhC [Aerophototrophica crusticola]|uniref:xanthine dehydrogenase accessory protein XdhC n=1 Tax=Aerophototrophica crusticola TaxID=1709002 RepID=UPI00384FA38C